MSTTFTDFNNFIDMWNEICRKNIKEYEALEQEPCEDAISRQAVLEQTYSWSKDEFLRVTNPFDYLRKRINSLPSINQQEPKTGHWIGIDEEPHEVWECDHCGFVIDGSGCIDPYDYRDTYKFCPNCGAKMVELQESEEV